MSAPDALVIGGGFYGAAIAIYLATQRGFSRVVLVERQAQPFSRASYNNQARVHNGYHYPRSFTTAFRSRVNLPRFLRDYPAAVQRDFTNLYAIARLNSKVTANQFRRFCREIGAPLEPAPRELRELFEPRLIEELFLVEEHVFDARRLAEVALQELRQAGVELRLETSVVGIHASPRELTAECESPAGKIELSARFLFNCTYSGLNQLGGEFTESRSRLKHEIAEMALVRVPEPFAKVGVTVMDGPFFSLMPFPPRGLHTLSHVRYTPHLHWVDAAGLDPYAKLRGYEQASRAERMIRDVARYVPLLREAEYVDSLFEVKTVLAKNEADDGRPILFERHAELPNAYSILGGKIDNIYDVLEKLDAEPLI